MSYFSISRTRLYDGADYSISKIRTLPPSRQNRLYPENSMDIVLLFGLSPRVILPFRTMISRGLIYKPLTECNQRTGVRHTVKPVRYSTIRGFSSSHKLHGQSLSLLQHPCVVQLTTIVKDGQFFSIGLTLAITNRMRAYRCLKCVYLSPPCRLYYFYAIPIANRGRLGFLEAEIVNRFDFLFRKVECLLASYLVGDHIREKLVIVFPRYRIRSAVLVIYEG